MNSTQKARLSLLKTRRRKARKELMGALHRLRRTMAKADSLEAKITSIDVAIQNLLGSGNV